MRTWKEVDAWIRVHSSWDGVAGTDCYRLWDEDRTIPRPSEGVMRVEILLDGQWERMYYNCVWGQSYDPEREGTWLKQKKSKNFSMDTGRQRFKVRYQMRSD